MTTLQDISLLITDGKHGDCQNDEDSDYYFISCKDVKDGWIDYSGARQITEADYLDTHKRTQLEPNDILITNSGTIGRMALVPNVPETTRTTFQKSVAIIKPNQEKGVPRWLYYSLMAKKDTLIAWAGGTAQKNLLLRDLRAFQVEVPPLPIQRKIVAILSAYDDLIENNTRRIKILEEMAQTIYREWFVNFRFSGHEKVKMVKSDLGIIPEGWKIVSVGEKFKIVLGGTPSRRKPEYWENGTIPWINSSKANELRVIDESELITEAGLSNSSTKLMPKRSTILAITGATLGQVSLLEKEVCANQSVVGIWDENSTFNEYIYLTFTNIIEDVINRASGGAQQHINKEIVNSTKIIVPQIGLLERLNEIVRPQFDLLRNILVANQILRQTRDLFLPKLISGDLDVSELNIETGGTDQ